jgi:hypothetical protein
MSDYFYQEGEISWFKEYINKVWDKWDPLGIPPQVYRDLENYYKSLELCLARLIGLGISLGSVKIDEWVEKSKNQLTQLVYTSYFLGLEHNNKINHIEPPAQIRHPAIELIRFPMITYVESILNELKKSNRVSQSEYDKLFESSLQIVIDTAKQCYEKGLLTPFTEVSDRTREINDHVSQIIYPIKDYNNLMLSLRVLMIQRPTLFGRKKWEDEVLMVLDKLNTTAKKLPKQNRHDEMVGIWFYLDQISKVTELMVKNFKAGIQDRDPNSTAKANINKDKIAYYFKLFDRSLNALEDTPSLLFYTFNEKWY